MNNIISASLTKIATTMEPSISTTNSADAPGPAMAVPSSAAAAAARYPEDAVDYVTVSDPVIHADGMNKFTSYRVDCRPPLNDPAAAASNNNNNNTANAVTDVFLQNNPGQYSSVLRRYSDFLWLYERLHKEKAGAIIPPLPEKQAVSRFSPEFVEDRRRALERFLRRVIFHPELWAADCLLTFLRADDVSFQHAKNVTRSEDANSNSNHGGGGGLDMSASLGGAGAFNLAPKNKAGIKKWFSEAKTTFSGDLVTSPDDDLFDEIERYIEALSVQMKRVSNQASGLVRKSKEIANGLFEFGLAFHQLGQSEGMDLGSKLQLMGGTADTLSSMAAQQADLEYKRLEEPFKDYIKIIHAVKLALNRRHDKRVSYTALRHEIQTREVNLHRLRMTPGSEAKAYSTEMSMQRYQAAANVAQEEYAECSQRVLREVDRFKREKAEEMKLVVLKFILLEIEVNRSMERVWADLVPRLEEGSVYVGGGEDSGQRQHPQQQQQQSAVVNMPPSHLPPPVPSSSAAMLPSSQPMYSNVPAAPMSAVDPMMDSSIQYRDNNLPGMGL
mmetsp:Transcript_26258/g.48299  ORF Transcript_26258/g.48299 Transcript_26258/m.48299 type:complete len:557 (+) Transcript_26258:143-1813(+)